MKFTPTRLADVLLIEPRVFGDERGFFMETFQQERFKSLGIDQKFVQDNQSRSIRGTLRGLSLPDQAHPGETGARGVRRNL